MWNASTVPDALYSINLDKFLPRRQVRCSAGGKTGAQILPYVEKSALLTNVLINAKKNKGRKWNGE